MVVRGRIFFIKESFPSLLNSNVVSIHDWEMDKKRILLAQNTINIWLHRIFSFKQQPKNCRREGYKNEMVENPLVWFSLKSTKWMSQQQRPLVYAEKMPWSSQKSGTNISLNIIGLLKGLSNNKNRTCIVFNLN